jgi:hypothetical protein
MKRVVMIGARIGLPGCADNRRAAAKLAKDSGFRPLDKFP